MKSKRDKNGKVVVIVASGVLVIGLACMIAGIVLMVKYSTKKTTESTNEEHVYTGEARRSGLDRLLDQLQRTHFELYPNRITTKLGVSLNEVRSKYQPMDLSPSRIKDITDTCNKLLQEFEELQTRVARENLSIREKRALEIAKFWAKHIMPYGVPYGYDYYIGDWMLSPDVFCWVPICAFQEFFPKAIQTFQPYSVEDMEKLKDILVLVKKSFMQYIENIKMGIEAGMVRNLRGCKAGYDGFKDKFPNIELYGEQAIFNTSKFLPGDFFDTFLSNMENRPNELEKWYKTYGKSMNESLREYFLENIGKPINDLLRYLREEHIQYCPPDHIIRGYNDLPVSFVYRNGAAIRPTTKKLPTGEPINGKEAYKKILNYFSTTDITPEAINQMGYKLMDEYFGEILAIAREVSGEKNNITAVEKFKKIIQSDEMYFNASIIPESESNENAYRLCSTEDGAKKHCPVRWQAMQNWFKYSRQIIAALDAKIINQFHFAGSKHTTPNCPVDLKPIFNPSSAAQAYEMTDSNCTHAAKYLIPFFLKKPGPKYEEWTVCAHETRPGHHLQAQGYRERFYASDAGIIKWLSIMTHFLGFQEGWAHYAESPLIAEDANAYKDEPLLKYGNLKWQVMQAIRLVADSAFHSIGNLTRDQARDIIHEYLWDNSDIPDKEITRYQSLPGQAITYLYGKLQILKLRRKAEQMLGDKFNIKDFHFHILHYGPTPFKFLEEMADRYIECVLNPNLEGCGELLNPPKFIDEKSVPREYQYSIS